MIFCNDTFQPSRQHPLRTGKRI